MTCRRSRAGRGGALILGSLLLAAALIGCGGRQPAEQRPAQPTIKTDWVAGKPGLWVEDPAAPRAMSEEEQQSFEELRSLGYLSGYKGAPARVGVTTYDRARASNGLNLVTSGHGPEALLMGMDGQVVHRWGYAYDRLGDTRERTTFEEIHSRNHFRRVGLYPNGDLVAMYDYLGLIKLDRASNLLWFYPGRAHHDLWLAPGGEIYTLTAEEHVIPRLNPTLPIREDFICRLDAAGREQLKVSVVECFENSRYAPILSYVKDAGGDILHTNSVAVLDGRLADKEPAFAAGNVLISVRNVHTLAVVDLARKTVSWAITGPWRAQHDPQVLANGHLLLFDNQGYDGFSRVLEFDPLTKEEFWSYVGQPPASFASRLCGVAQRLQNGDTLITDTCSGRAFEVTADSKEVVWDFYNPHRAGEKGDLIAALLEVKRLPADFPTGWLAPVTP